MKGFLLFLTIAGVIALLSLALPGCAPQTHLPSNVDSDDSQVPYLDNSTPKIYAEGLAGAGKASSAFDSGYLYEYTYQGRDYMVITADRAKREPTATPFTDFVGNHVFIIDASIPINEFSAKKKAQVDKFEGVKTNGS